MKVLNVFLDVNMSKSFDSLHALCSENDIHIHKLDIGNLICFVNKRRTYIKILACNGTTAPVIAAYRLPNGRIYDLRVISYIPKVFRGGRVEFDEALRLLIENKLAKEKK